MTGFFVSKLFQKSFETEDAISDEIENELRGKMIEWRKKERRKINK
jgi:hypothetical protein